MVGDYRGLFLATVPPLVVVNECDNHEENGKGQNHEEGIKFHVSGGGLPLW
jgi:hypothetical protein